MHWRTTIGKKWGLAQINKSSRILLKKLITSTNFNFTKINKEIIKLNPTNIAILIRILSGHNTLNYHLFDMGYSYNPYCEYWTTPETQNNDTAEIETATHIICDCPAFTRIRIEVYGKHITTLEKLFSEESIKYKFKNMIKFIKKNKMLWVWFLYKICYVVCWITFDFLSRLSWGNSAI